MAKEFNLADYFQPYEPKDVKVLDSPEDIAEMERFNEEMRIVQRRVRYAFALSRELARGLILTRSA